MAKKADAKPNAQDASTGSHESSHPAQQDMERYDRLIEASERQINRAWKAYGILASLITVLVVAAGISSIRSINDFKAQLREDVKDEKDRLTKRVDLQIAEELKTENVERLI